MPIINPSWRATHAILAQRCGVAWNFRVMLAGSLANGTARARGSHIAEWRVRDGEWEYTRDSEPFDSITVTPVEEE